MMKGWFFADWLKKAENSNSPRMKKMSILFFKMVVIMNKF